MGLKEKNKKGKKNKAILVFLTITSLCIAHGSALCQDRSPREPIPVKVVEAKMEGSFPLVIAMGTVNHITKVDLGFELYGVLKSVPVQEGEYVKRGQIIAVLDQSLLEAELKKNETALEFAKVQLVQSDHEIAKAKVKVEKTEQFFHDQKKLFDIGAIIRSTLDEAELKYETAKEELKGLEATAAGGKRDAELKIHKAEAELESIKVKIEKSTIRAPISGMITKKYLSSFDLVRDQYQLIVTLVDLDEMYAEVDVNEKDFPKIRIGESARVVVDAFPGKKFNGTVSKIDSTVNKDNRTFLVKIRLKNPGHQMRPGMFLRAEILSDQRKGGLMIPKECLIKGRDDKRRVFVITDEVAFLREVKIGSERGDLVEIVKGVKDGERVVIEGYERLFDLAPVRSASVSEGRR